MNFKTIVFNRTIVHKIFSKKDKVEPYSEPSDKIITLDTGTEDELKNRIFKAIKQSKRFFETEIADTHGDSFWARASILPKSDLHSFITTTQVIAELAASKHNKGYIPGGLLIISDCEIDNYPSVIIIKAELQEAFSLTGDVLKLIKELFLSPAKELYKIGFLIQNKPNKASASSYLSFVYDDHFKPKNDDLATYFYRDFLGFETSKNDKLLTNNFLKDYGLFIDKYIAKFEDKRDLKIHLKNDMRAGDKGIIDPTEYVGLLPKQIQQHYENEILNKYSNSFTKDTGLINFDNYTIEVTPNIKLSASSGEISNIDVLDAGIEKDVKKVITRIDSGTLNKIILIANP